MNAGVTGHQDLGPPAKQLWVKHALAEAIDRLPVHHGFSCLAEGADQLYAELLIERGIPFTAVISSRGYSESFKSLRAKESYISFLDLAAGKIQLDYPAPSESAFYAGGQEVVRCSELLIAVWNGKPSKGLGGTADIVAFAKSCGRPIIHLNPETRSSSELSSRLGL